MTPRGARGQDRGCERKHADKELDGGDKYGSDEKRGAEDDMSVGKETGSRRLRRAGPAAAIKSSGARRATVRGHQNEELTCMVASECMGG